MKSSILLAIPFASMAYAAAIQTNSPWFRSKVIAQKAANSTVTTAAAAVTKAISDGIDLNVMAAQGELAATQDLMNAVQQGKTADPAVYAAGKKNLMAFVNAGIAIRQNNMALAKNNPQLLRGLSNIEASQAKEVGLTSKLTGDATKDGAVLQSLQKAFQADISTNKGLQNNLGSVQNGPPNGPNNGTTTQSPKPKSPKASQPPKPKASQIPKSPKVPGTGMGAGPMVPN
ncbi:hypothetical protein BT63DRAFT_452003 [Microthyrium microscopicum]|uniref:Small secreted protein n=1 Tax=Microthyrium microscopicum TaxID=703497 RepID=A0A6A6URB1_9PEZI|nr:hypothetical protein BT63DRAFT_452003 [Microthyrium microscopicum]